MASQTKPGNPIMNPRQPKGSPQQPEPSQAPWREVIIWVLFLVFFTVWYLNVRRPQARPEVSLPYSAFLDQVRASNVAKVRIVGDEITGFFAKPIPWPEAKDTKGSAPLNPKTSPATKPPTVESDSAAPLTYNEFQTTFPSAIGDPNLISINC